MMETIMLLGVLFKKIIHGYGWDRLPHLKIK